jgi:hypothetical protein
VSDAATLDGVALGALIRLSRRYGLPCHGWWTCRICRKGQPESHVPDAGRLCSDCDRVRCERSRRKMSPKVTGQNWPPPPPQAPSPKAARRSPEDVAKIMTSKPRPR